MCTKIKVDLIVKLGGSAITDKELFETLKPEALKDAAILIRGCVRKNKKIIVVHGAGSFGHHQAKEYKVNDGFAHLDKDESHKARMGFCLTHRSVTMLNNHVVDSLLAEDVPAVPCSPCGSWLTADRSVASDGVDTVREILTAGFVPVLHGDTVRDTRLGACILSGDTVIKTLCQKLDVSRVVFLTDVEGVFDRPPREAGSTLFRQVQIKDDGSVTSSISMSTPTHDVTGGIRLKIQTAVDIVTAGQCRVFICQLGSKSAETLCLGGELDEHTLGTEIVSNK